MMSCAKAASFTAYKNTNPDLSFEWKIPSDWQYEEFGLPRLGFLGVVFMPKKDQGAKVFRPNFIVIAKKAEAFKLPAPVTFDAVALDAEKRCLKLSEARILKRSVLKVSGEKAALIDVEYKGRTKIYDADAEDVMLRERIIIVGRGAMFYTIRYVNDKKKFTSQEPLFRQSLKSFLFLAPAGVSKK